MNDKINLRVCFRSPDELKEIYESFISTIVEAVQADTSTLPTEPKLKFYSKEVSKLVQKTEESETAMAVYSRSSLQSGYKQSKRGS